MAGFWAWRQARRIFLDDGQLGRAAFQAKIAARDHDGVGDFEDGIELVHGVLALDLGHDRNPGPMSGDLGLDVLDVLLALHKGQGHGVDADIDALVQVTAVLVGHGRDLECLSGKGDALVGSQDAAVQRLHHDQTIRLDDLDHRELQHPVGQRDGHALGQAFEQFGRVKAYENVALVFLRHVRSAQADIGSLADLQRRALDFADADLGAAEVAHDRQGNAGILFDLPDLLNDRTEIFRVGVGKIEAKDPHPKQNHFLHDVLIHGCRAQGRHYLCAHVRIPVRDGWKIR